MKKAVPKAPLFLFSLLATVTKAQVNLGSA
jgi:hypothetical protein